MTRGSEAPGGCNLLEALVAAYAALAQELWSFLRRSHPAER
jgi:hypothetical protein